MRREAGQVGNKQGRLLVPLKDHNMLMEAREEKFLSITLALLLA